MAKTDDLKQVDIGFIAGQVLNVHLSDGAYASLVKALKSGDAGWQEIESEDATIVLDTNKVAYIRVGTEEHRVGFSVG